MLAFAGGCAELQGPGQWAEGPGRSRGQRAVVHQEVDAATADGGGDLRLAPLGVEEERHRAGAEDGQQGHRVVRGVAGSQRDPRAVRPRPVGEAEQPPHLLGPRQEFTEAESALRVADGRPVAVGVQGGAQALPQQAGHPSPWA